MKEGRRQQPLAAVGDGARHFRHARQSEGVDTAAALARAGHARVWDDEAALTAKEADRADLLDALEFHLRTTYHEMNEQRTHCFGNSSMRRCMHACMYECMYARHVVRRKRRSVAVASQ